MGVIVVQCLWHVNRWHSAPVRICVRGFLDCLGVVLEYRILHLVNVFRGCMV